MPFALIIVGIILLVSGVRNTHPELYNLVKQDFSGDKSYVRWMLAILIIGAIGYIPEMKPLSRAFLVLVVIGLFISNGGFFDKFQQDLLGTNYKGSI
jgi:uncharacterized membrane protein HdeD (DUF308 family)